VGHQVAQGDALLAVGAELREKADHRVVPFELPPLPKLGEGHGRHRLGGGEPEHQVTGGEGLPGAVLAESAVRHRLAAQGDVELRSKMETLADALFDGLTGFGELGERIGGRGVGHGGRDCIPRLERPGRHP
jgi:hypothetical protein